jgi:hypothetical protein
VNKAVNPVSAGPVGLYRDRVEILFGDQPLCNPPADLVKLVRTMRCFAEKYKPRVSNPLEQWIEIAIRACQLNRKVV